MEQLREDLGYAVRALARSPGFALTAVGVLALGIGANTAIFSLASALFLRPPGVARPERLVGVTAREGDRVTSQGLSWADYESFRTHAGTLDGVAAHGRSWLYLRHGESFREVVGSEVSGEFFTLLGLVPERGRLLGPADAEPGAAPAAVLSHRLWRRLGGGESEADPLLGATVWLNGHPFPIVGVAPASFRGVYSDERRDVWISTSQARVTSPGAADSRGHERRWLDLVGRVATGRSAAEVQVELEGLARRLAATHPGSHAGWSVDVEPLVGPHPRYVRQMLKLPSRLAAVVGLVLLIACSNLAGLLLNRNLARAPEIGIRLALGAGRRRLLRLLLTESLLLGVLGAGCGLLVAAASRGVIARLYGESLSGADLRLDVSALLFTVALGLLTGLAFGLMPAWRAARFDLVAMMRGGSPGGPSRLRGVLVGAQVALALVLLIGAGLLLASLSRVLLAPGLDVERIAHARLRLSRVGYSAERARGVYRELQRRLEAIPGVRGTALARVAPGRGWCCPERVSLPGAPARAAAPPFEVENNAVTPGYLRMLGIPVLAGRGFDERDREGAPAVAIVNQTLARQMWAGASPLGRVLLIADLPHEVVGIARDTLPPRSDETSVPFFYTSYWQAEQSDARVFVRVAGDTGPMLGLLPRVVAQVDPAVHVGQVMSLAERTRLSNRSELLLGTVLGATALVALLLSSLGLGGTIAFGVRRRRRELGVRAALGAAPGDLVRLVVGQGLRLAAFGVAAGLLGAYGGSRVLAASIYGVSARDPLIFAASALALLGVALLASLLPARRAAAVEAWEALRTD